MSQMYTKEVEVLAASVVPNTKEEDVATKNTISCTYAPIWQVQSRLIWQRKSNDCCKLEEGDLQLLLYCIPSNSVTNHNIQPTNISYDRIHSIWECYECCCINSLLNPGQQSPTDLLQECHDYYCIKLVRLLNQLYSKFGCFSQSTACIPTRFGECSLTLLDMIWYTYSYIYKPATTIIWYRIYRFLNSWHTSPFQLLSSFKHANPSASTPLFTISSFTTRSTRQLLIPLESISASSLSITLGAFVVNFIQPTIFLYCQYWQWR